MAKSLGAFRAALLIGWVALGAAGILYARLKDIPNAIAFSVTAAFLLEYPFYLVPAFPEIRKRLAGPALPLFLLASLFLPYLVCYAGTGQLSGVHAVQLAALVFALSLWYVVLPVTVVTDLAFLALAGVVILSSYLVRIYPDPYPALKLNAILGRVGVFRTIVLVLLLDRRVSETGYGFIPTRKEWRIGALHYLGFLLVAACVALPLKAVHIGPPAPLWKTIGVFLGFFWVVGLFEEFVFRGVLQQWLEQWAWSRTAALGLTSAAFGLVHLWFRNFPFPNWRWALLAGILGWFCGHARNQAGSIRAGVVTHALVVATWRGFFT